MFNKEDVRNRMREAVGRSKLRRVAREAGVAPNTLYGFIDKENPTDPQGDTVEKMGRWLEGRTEPDDYWRGVSYAAQAMAETVARLLAEMNTSARSGAHPDANKVKQAGKGAPVRTGQKAESPRQETGPVAQSTAPLPASTDSE